jgi:hypothetical protein
MLMLNQFKDFLPVIGLNFSPVTDKQMSLQSEDELASKWQEELV